MNLQKQMDSSMLGKNTNVDSQDEDRDWVASEDDDDESTKNTHRVVFNKTNISQYLVDKLNDFVEEYNEAQRNNNVDADLRKKYKTLRQSLGKNVFKEQEFNRTAPMEELMEIVFDWQLSAQNISEEPSNTYGQYIDSGRTISNYTKDIAARAIVNNF